MIFAPATGQDVRRWHCLRHDGGAVLWHPDDGHNCFVCGELGTPGWPPAAVRDAGWHDPHRTNYETEEGK